MPKPPDGPSADLDDLLPDLGVADVLLQRPQGIGTSRQAVRIAVAVTVSFVIAQALSQSEFALFAPITTLLVVQSSPWTTLGVSVQRILGTGLGVLVASVYVNVLGLSWWSFLIGVLAALLVARQLPWSLGGQLQIPVAVVFVLALGPGSVEQDLWRVLDVVIGGAIGLAAVFIYPPRPKPAPFEDAMRTYRDAVIGTLRDVGAESALDAPPLEGGVPHAYVAPSRRLRDHADKARTELLRLLEGTQFNLRAGAVSDDLAARALRLRRLSGIGVQVRGIVGAANRSYGRVDVDPVLTGAEFNALVEDTCALLEASLGGPADDVGAGARSAVEALDRDLAERIRRTANVLAARPEDAGDVLSSVSLLGRLDHVRMQAAAFPSWES